MSFLPADAPSGRPLGRIALVGSGPGAADLLTLRALERLRTADVVFYDRLVDPAVLALTPARTVFVGKEVGANSWPQARINAVIVVAALEGLRVVRLKSGDPSVFGRASEELEAARLAGIPVEIVPGITAASAAAASLGRPLTERGQTERLLIATATCRPGAVANVAAGFSAGSTLVLYMAMHRLAEVEVELLAAGAPADCKVDIVQHVETSTERHLQSRLQGMAQTASAAGFGNPAIVLVCWPKAESLPIQGMRRPRPIEISLAGGFSVRPAGVFAFVSAQNEFRLNNLLACRSDD